MSQKLFTKEREALWSVEDAWWNVELKQLRTQYNAKAAVYKDVAFFKNYIPLFRFHENEECFTMAESGVIYAWNHADLPEKDFERIVKEAKEKFNLQNVKADSDCGGF